MFGLENSDRRRVKLGTILVAVLMLAPLSHARSLERVAGQVVDCTVPGTHTTIQMAVDDAGCNFVGLAAVNYIESVTVSRSISIIGSPSTLWGSLTIAEDGTEVEVDELEIGPDALFVDGFESGDTTAWSGTQ